MVHGMGFRDRKHLCYWGRVPKRLESLGAEVFFGHQDSVGSVESNADIIAKSLDEILAKTGAEKVNILAHSKGGLEARYLINHGYADKVASVTTIDTPHHGSKTVDFLMKAPKWMVKTAAWGTDVWMKILGDKNPDSYDCFDLFTTRTAEQFNIDNPAPDNIYCQSSTIASIFSRPGQQNSSILITLLPTTFTARATRSSAEVHSLTRCSASLILSSGDSTAIMTAWYQ